MKKLISIIAVTVILASVTVLFLYSGNNKLETAPDISLNIIDGSKVELQALQGKPLLVTFWATTCVTCVKEIPHLVKLYNDIGKEQLEIIAIAMPYDPPNIVVELSERKNIPYPIALDINGEATRAFGDIKVTPTSFLIDAHGKVVQQNIGEINIEQLRLKVKELQTTISVS